MQNIKPIILASRKSDLARLQSYRIGDALSALPKPPQVSYHFRESLGDINQEDPLWQMPEKGVFTEDFRQGLLQGSWDAVVHSWKDLPVEQEPGTEIIATLPRADVRDMLLLKKSHLDSVKKSRNLNVFSSSPRRIYNLTPFFKNFFPGGLEQVNFESVRGNILTRVTKLINNPEVDGLIVAKAAMDRLLSAQRPEFEAGQSELRAYLSECLWQVLPVSENPTAAAQGAIVVEVASERQDLKELFAQVHCRETWECVQSERKILKSHGGGCHQKIGVNQLMRNYGALTFLKGETEQGQILDSATHAKLELRLSKPYTGKPHWFQRKKIDYVKPASVNANYISRISAVPDDVSFPSDDIVWTAGLKTWKALAERGHWVHGSSESLGEAEDDRLEALRPSLRWGKWTHLNAPVSKKMSHIATYELQANEVLPDLSEYQEFYWMSGSQFELAVKHQPKILTRDHYCGPGNTFAIISERLKESGIEPSITILSNYQLWQDAIKEFE